MTIIRTLLSSAAVVALAILGSAASADPETNATPPGRTVILGFPTHGTNMWNGGFIHDYSEVTNHPLVAAPEGPFYQIGLLNPDGQREDLIVEDSDTSRIIATSSEMVENFIAPGLYDPFDPIFNKPFSQLGTLFFGSQTIFDRAAVVPFDDCDATQFIYAFCYKPGASIDPTLAEWNRARVRLTVNTTAEGRSRFRIKTQGALKQTLFTVWLVGVTDNFEETPVLTASPLGGIPNILLTDENGDGLLQGVVRQDILRPCERGPGKGCELYISLVWHPEGAAFGGTPSIDFIGHPSLPGTPGLPVGVVSVAQMFIPLQGEPVLDVRQVYRDNR